MTVQELIDQLDFCTDGKRDAEVIGVERRTCLAGIRRTIQELTIIAASYDEMAGPVWIEMEAK